ncbi:MAG: CinA family nicotinamide mononucleotide deamidase-related protein [Anaerolineales bacterium]|nr:CinA family nicotinamide mononucleotide deamidase-related protein [Anaerolineales bacterium]
MIAEIIAIGNELLLGEIADTNTQWIARTLREEGIEVRRATAVGDHLERIAAAFREAAERSDAVIATGGLGPTVDDPTRDAAAEAAGVGLVFQPELWEEIRDRFRILGRAPTDNNRKQAQLPQGAEALSNPFGTAPGFALEIGRAVLFAVPGVPSEMEAMIREGVLPALRRRGGGPAVIRKRVLHVVGLGESQIDERIGRWESMENPIVGLNAHAGLTDVRIVSRAAVESEALAVISAAESDIRSALRGYVVGADEQTLAGAVLGLLPPGAALASVESGTAGALAALLEAEESERYLGGRILGAAGGSRELAERTRGVQADLRATHAVGLAVLPAKRCFRSEYVIRCGDAVERKVRTHLIPRPLACRWAATVALTACWNLLKESAQP